MKYYIFLIIWIFAFNISLAQNHDAIWMFGKNVPNSTMNAPSVLNFNSEPPLAELMVRQMNINATFSSFSDVEGNLKLYTNGIYLAGADDLLVENGDSLNTGQLASMNAAGGYRIVQSCFFLENPGNSDLLHLFHLYAEIDPMLGVVLPKLYETQIDFSQDPLGVVLSKNVELLSAQLATITGTRHANGRDWWLLVSEQFSNSYHVLLFNPDGITDTSFYTFDPPIDEKSNGTIKFVPDGSKLIRFDISDERIDVFGFDRCTGQMTTIDNFSSSADALGNGLSVSPNSRFFYCTSRNEMYQYDLWADDIGASETLIATYDEFLTPVGLPTSFFLSQLGPDGRIYHNATNAVEYMHTIQYPNKLGLACEVRQHSVELPRHNTFTMPHFPNYRLGPLDGSPCDTLGIDNHPLAGFRYEADTLNVFLHEFTDHSFYEPTDWFWDFDDSGATSTEKDPLHEFSEIGVYNVCLTVSNANSSDTFCREVEVIVNDATDVVVQDFGVRIAPNPIGADGEFTVFTTAYLRDRADLIFYNQLGEEVKRFGLEKGGQVFNYTLPEMVPGIYFYNAVQRGQVVAMGKIVRQ